MTRRKTVTAQNRAVAKELMRSIPVMTLREFGRAVSELEQLAAADPSAVTVEDALSALAAVRKHRAVLDARLWHLLGVATLDATAVSAVAANAKVLPRTLSRRLATSPARWAGHPLTTDLRRVYGWRTAS